MNPIRNLRVGVKLYASFALVVGIFALVAFLQIRGVHELIELQQVVVERDKAVEQAQSVDSRLEGVYAIAADAIINRNLDEAAKEFAEASDQAEKDIKAVAGLADVPEEKALAETFAKHYRELLGLIGKELLPYLKSGGEDREKIREIDGRIDVAREKAMAQLDKIVENMDAESAKAVKESDAVASASVRTAYTLSGIGMLAAAIIAGLITAGIAGPLKKANGFARAVAAGNIDQELAIDQRDEVGQACAALKDIVATLRAVLDEFGDSARQIALGRLRARGDAGKFSGAFAKLIADANRMADCLVGYLDVLPAPLMTIDNQFVVQFMNKAGASAGGADPLRLQGTKCHDHFRTGDCQTPGCACDKAMRAGNGAASETVARPGNLELDIAYSAVPIRDDRGNVVGAFEIVMDQTAIKNAQRKMQRLAQQAEGIANSVSSAAEELSAQVEQSSRGAETQRERATETATAMEEMNSTVMEVAKNASSAAMSADSTQAKAREGARNVGALVAAVQDIKSQMDALSLNMAGLGKQAEGISGILNVISDIADQTNLLALNAAIEAARAGDAGRGFAVVADEVRKLAEKTQSATKEVGDAITAIQERSRKSVGETQRAAETVAESAETAKASGQALGEIVQLIEETTDQVRAIATASEQQSAASEEINRSTEEINRISAETSQAMTQSSAAIMELARRAQELNDLIAEMNA
jgi:methyl-accepting chemotaxis protein